VLRVNPALKVGTPKIYSEPKYRQGIQFESIKFCIKKEKREIPAMPSYKPARRRAPDTTDKGLRDVMEIPKTPLGNRGFRTPFMKS